jgi:phosphate-selective porin OprO/OprP
LQVKTEKGKKALMILVAFRRATQGILLGSAFGFLGASAAVAQSPPTPGPSDNPPPAVASPPPPSSVATPAALSREEQLEARVRQLEAIVERLSAQMAAQQMSGPVRRVTQAVPEPDTGVPNMPPLPGTAAPSAMGGAGAPGQSLPPNPVPMASINSPATLADLKGHVKFGPGFEIRTDDDEFIFQFHDLTQADYRGYLQGGQTQVHDTFAIPRQWFMFSGRVGLPFGYFVSLAQGFDDVNLLDAFVDIDLDPRLRFRVGRFKTPFTYEFFVEPIQGLVVPERSIFFNNEGENRDVGFMAFGRLFDNHVDYGVGMFNGNRNGYLANQDGKAITGLVNILPFINQNDSVFQFFNIGGSVFAQPSQAETPIPQTFRTIVPTTGNAVIGVPFLSLNDNVEARGPMALWDLHAAWFWKGWALIGEWGSGYQTYAISSTPNNRTAIPVQAFYTQVSYLVTGETRSSIGIVKPTNPVTFKPGGGWGAWEPYFRYEYFDLSNKVFTAGFADPNLWANRVFQTWVGINWHLTQYIKIYFDWNHAEFNQPVFFAPGRRQLTSDTLAVRLQLFF